MRELLLLLLLLSCNPALAEWLVSDEVIAKEAENYDNVVATVGFNSGDCRTPGLIILWESTAAGYNSSTQLTDTSGRVELHVDSMGKRTGTPAFGAHRGFSYMELPISEEMFGEFVKGRTLRLDIKIGDATEYPRFDLMGFSRAFVEVLEKCKRTADSSYLTAENEV